MRRFLSGEERRHLDRCRPILAKLAVKEGVQQELFSYIWKNTIGSGRFEKVFETKRFYKGDEFSIGICDLCGVGRDAVMRAKTDLSKRNVFCFKLESMGDWRKHKTLVRVNVSNIARFVYDLRQLLYGLVIEDEGQQRLRSIAEKGDKYYAKMGWKQKEQILTKRQQTRMAELGEEARASGIAKRKEIIEKRKERKLQPSWIGDIMSDFCEIHAAPYQDRWTKKLLGMAKNWLKEMAFEELEPVELLGTICKKWPQFRSALKSDEGKKILLRRSVSFEQYYQYRRQIMDWLACEKIDGVEVADDDGRFVDWGDE